MADTTLLSGLSGGWVDNKMVLFHIRNNDWTKEISFANGIFLDQEPSTKTIGIGIYTISLQPQDNTYMDKVGSQLKVQENPAKN